MDDCLNSHKTGERKIYLDNLRTIVIVLVIVFHSLCSYVELAPMWPFHDQDQAPVLDILIILLDLLMMPVLFFLAGYFSYHSLENHNAVSFIRKKTTRLLLPWLIGAVLFLPLLDYLFYTRQILNRGGEVLPFFQYWLACLRRVLDFKTGFLDMNRYITMPEQFYMRYLWFLSLLLLFLMLALVWNRFSKFLHGKISPHKKPATPSPLNTLLKLNICLVPLFYLLHARLSPDFAWFSLGNVWHFQPAKAVIYLGFFFLGYNFYQQQSLERSSLIRMIWPWAVVFIVLFSLLGVTGKVIRTEDNPALFYRLLFIIVYPLLIESILFLMLALFKRFFNNTTAVLAILAPCSYDMYLLHYIFVMGIPLLLVNLLAGHGYIKFLLTACLAVCLTILAAKIISKWNYIVRIAALLAVFCLVGLITAFLS